MQFQPDWFNDFDNDIDNNFFYILKTYKSGHLGIYVNNRKFVKNLW
jgi:hypothetical protein